MSCGGFFPFSSAFCTGNVLVLAFFFFFSRVSVRDRWIKDFFFWFFLFRLRLLLGKVPANREHFRRSPPIRSPHSPSNHNRIQRARVCQSPQHTRGFCIGTGAAMGKKKKFIAGPNQAFFFFFFYHCGIQRKRKRERRLWLRLGLPFPDRDPHFWQKIPKTAYPGPFGTKSAEGNHIYSSGYPARMQRWLRHGLFSGSVAVKPGSLRLHTCTPISNRQRIYGRLYLWGPEILFCGSEGIWEWGGESSFFLTVHRYTRIHTHTHTYDRLTT